jgi:hypothetical protein
MRLAVTADGRTILYLRGCTGDPVTVGETTCCGGAGAWTP